MQKKRNNRGFSLAELLIVVAIMVALAAVAFVAVQNHQRSMTQLEYDTIAKEIFVAAQNHLTAAESQGYPGLPTTIEKREENKKYGTLDDLFSENKEEDKVYYFVYPNPGAAADMLELMLPFGAIDETIRAGGSYLIRYQPSSARVLDVFYSNKGHTAWLTTKGKDLPSTAFETLMTDCRKTGAKEYDGAVVGWYGDGDALPVGTKLEAPQVFIYNEETLWVEVKDTNSSGTLVLLITGETSEAKKAFYLRNGTTSSNGNRISDLKVVLDDITLQGFHFAEIEAETSSPPFIPGENITIEAVVFNNSELTNVAYSGKGRTNSIFADPSSYIPVQTGTSSGSQGAKTDDLKINGTIVDETSGTAAVANFRHLENLDRIVSNWGEDLKKSSQKEIKFTSAIQLTNLSDNASDEFSWTSFVGKTQGSIMSIITLKNGQTNSKNYLPVYLEPGFDYFGRNHIVSDVESNGILTGDSQRNATGVFGELNGGSVSNLLVLDSKITSSGYAGGLIGSMSGTTVEKCGAYGTVSSSGNAGGLIGSASGGSVTSCYSAGHTEEGSYEKWIDANTYDVTGATAGGLIGVSSATISNSYSTCSVSGTGTAGGFVGNAEGGSIENCYAVGLVTIQKNDQNQSVNGKIGAFAGEMPETLTPSNCYYYSVINEVKRTEKRGNESVEVFDHYLGPVGDAEKDGVTEIDLNAKSYEDFVGAQKDWDKAEPHDESLKEYYRGYDQTTGEYYQRYNLKGISRLDGSAEIQTDGTTETLDPIVYTHYGDWPAPEIFVFNAKNQ